MSHCSRTYYARPTKELLFMKYIFINSVYGFGSTGRIIADKCEQLKNNAITNRNTTMDTKALRQKILDLAIHGKLVPQDPNDEPASVLLERIKAEKERLIKEGKIKRSKKSAKTSDTPHYENVPFEIPNS